MLVSHGTGLAVFGPSGSGTSRGALSALLAGVETERVSTIGSASGPLVSLLWVGTVMTIHLGFERPPCRAAAVVALLENPNAYVHSATNTARGLTCSNPASAKLNASALLKIMWSSSGILSTSPAALSFAVTARSSSEGVT